MLDSVSYAQLVLSELENIICFSALYYNDFNTHCLNSLDTVPKIEVQLYLNLNNLIARFSNIADDLKENQGCNSSANS